MTWKEIEEEKPEVQTQEDLDKFCNLCHQSFVTSIAGKKLFDILLKHLETPVCPPDQNPNYGYFREGQNNIIRQFQKAILYHEEKIKKGPEETK